MTKSLVIDGRTMNTVEVAQLNVDWFGWPDAPGGEKFDARCGETAEEYRAAYHAQLCDEAINGDPYLIEWKAEHEADFMAASHEFGEDVDFAQADMLYRDDEARWYRFMVA